MWETIIVPLLESVTSVLVTIILCFPASPVSFNNYVEALDEYLPYLNYFIPFYLFAPVLNAFLIAMLGSVVLIFIWKFVISKMQK